MRSSSVPISILPAPYSPRRLTTRVLIGSLAAASANASCASCFGTPSISNMMRPGCTRQTQYSGVPLPEPMRTSAGLRLTGTSGKIRIHTLPTRFMWRVMARRAASIWRAGMRAGSIAFRAKAPKLSDVPPLAAPWMRPLCPLRNLVRFGESMFLRPYSSSGARSARRLMLHGPLVEGHRVVGHDLALEHPDLHAAGAIGRLGRRLAEIDLGAQRMQRHAAFAVPLHAGDFRPAQPAGAVDADAERTEAHRRLNRALHGAAERDAALQLLADVVGDQLGVDLGLADLDDVEAHLGARHLGEVGAQLLDVGALLADDDART